ncbi:MAG: hypothetical protein QM704_00985 [Anaeromyxobacteraceae bacterium]
MSRMAWFVTAGLAALAPAVAMASGGSAPGVAVGARKHSDGYGPALRLELATAPRRLDAHSDYQLVGSFGLSRVWGGTRYYLSPEAVGEGRWVGSAAEAALGVRLGMQGPGRMRFEAGVGVGLSWRRDDLQGVDGASFSDQRLFGRPSFAALWDAGASGHWGVEAAFLVIRGDDGIPVELLAAWRVAF